MAGVWVVAMVGDLIGSDTSLANTEDFILKYVTEHKEREERGSKYISLV